MFQNSSIEEMPVLLDRILDSAPDLLLDQTWFDREIASLETPLRYPDPASHWIPPFIKPALDCVQTFNFGNAARRVLIHPHEETIFTVGSPTRNAPSEITNTIQVWNWRTGDHLFLLSGHQAPITAIALSHDGTTLVSGSHDRTIKLWHVATGKELATLKGHPTPIGAIAISADGKTVVSSGCNQYEIRDRNLRVWNEGKITHILPCITDAPTLMTATSGSVLLKIEPRSEVVNLETGETFSKLNWLTSCEQVLTVAPDWQSAATIVGRQVIICEMTTGEIRCRIPLDLYDRAIQVSALSPDGKWFVAGFQRTEVHPRFASYLPRQNVLRIWNAQTGELLESLSQADLGQGLWQSLKFSQQGHLLVTSVGKSLKVWQCKN